MGKKRTRQDTKNLEDLIRQSPSIGNLEQIKILLEIELENSITNERVIEILYSAVVNNRDDVFIYLATEIFYNSLFILFDVRLEAIHNKASELNNEGRIQISPIIYEIPSDGNCMYNAIIAGYNQEITVESLRQQVYEVIQSDLDRYIPQLESQFLEILRSGNIQLGFSPNVLNIITDIISIEETLRLPAIRESNLIESYIATIRQDGIWGGDVELGILSQVLNIQIEINRAGGSIITINNTGDDNALLVNIDQNENHYNLILGYELRETARLDDGSGVYIEDYSADSNHTEVYTNTLGTIPIFHNSEL